MKLLEDLDHYEILELGMDATSEQVEKAYRMLQATYAPDSLAVYSLLDSADVTAMNERVESAYQLLSNEKQRREYDQSLKEMEQSVGAFETVGPGLKAQVGDANAQDQGEDEPQEFDGSGLRGARERKSISLEQVASMTKINSTYLRWIEDNSYDELPALVYVRGFVTSYARAIGLDPERVAASYMSHLEQARSDSPQGRRPGGK